MTDLLSQAQELEVSKYTHLKNPIFKGQTAVDADGMYWMVFEEDGKLYKFHNKL